MRARRVAFSASQSWHSPILYNTGCTLFSGFFVGSEKITEFVPCRIHLAVGSLSAAKQVIELGLGGLRFAFTGRAVRIGTRLEPVAEIRVFPVAHFFGPFLPALAGQARIVKPAHTAGMQIGAALRALRQAAERQRQPG